VREARDRIWAVRKGTTLRAEAAQVVEKHVNRKDPDRHFVNDRASRRRVETDNR